MGSVAGGASGSVLGPVGGGIGAGVGYAGGKTAQMMSENEDLKETVDALTHGDVNKLVAQGMKQHQSGFDEFTSSIKKILTVAAAVLLGYLCIPIFLAKKTATHCAKQEARKQYTNAPFPVKPSSSEKY
jgi:phage-related protein